MSDQETHEESGLSKVAPPLPFENSGEYARFVTWLHVGPGRSVGKAYRAWCEMHGHKAARRTPSSWFKLARGEFAAIRQAEKQAQAIARAGDVHGRIPDWAALEVLIRGENEHDYDSEPFGPLLLQLALIDWGFHAIAIDIHGNPIPGQLTWEERSNEYWRQNPLNNEHEISVPWSGGE